MGPEWVYEVEWDGLRVLAEVADGRLHLVAPDGHDVTPCFPELGALTHLVPDVVLDGTGRTAEPPRPTPSPARNNPSFNLVNQSGRVIEQFYASPSSQGGWGPDRLGNDVVQPNGRFAVSLPLGDCQYDIRVVWRGGDAQERRNLNTALVTLCIGAGMGTATVIERV